MKMKFKDFEFLKNPTLLEIQSSTVLGVSNVIGQSSIVEGTGINPTTVKGSGQVFGEEGEAWCEFFTHLLKENTDGWLYIPNSSPIKAYLKSFEYKQSSKQGGITYSFEFIESVSRKNELCKLSVVVALENDNAYKIANRYNVPVEQIMELNEIKNPFSINAGDKVVLR